MSAASELLDEIVKTASRSGEKAPSEAVLSFELAYHCPPDVDLERHRILTVLGSECFDLAPIDEELPNFLVLRFRDVWRTVSRRGQFAIADELANRLELKSCIPEGVTNFPTDEMAGRPDAEGQIGEKILDVTCWSKINDKLKPDWIVEFLGLKAAWQATKGDGVRIAQPDTGTAEHPELDGNINKMLAFDVFKGRPGEANDPLSSSMKNPGHGTAVGSVINSSHGSILLGVAPKAELVPIRCVDSVVFGLDGSNIAKAILYARKIGADVISMSLGGPFVSNSIREALELATRDGIIVVSAAGNCVGLVVYPAFDQNSLAIAGVGAEGKKWKGTSIGPDIDIAAPSENVFAARRDPDDGGQGQIRQSQGTSFGTAITAGVAALWLSKHGVERVRSAAASHGITVNEMFRLAVRQTARVPHQWDQKLGAGIVNAEQLLALPLSKIVKLGIPRPRPGPGPLAAHFKIAELARRAETVDGFDWARHGAEAVYLSAETLAREDPRLSALSESASCPMASETLTRQKLPDVLQNVLKNGRGAPLLAPAYSPPVELKVDSLNEFRKGGLERDGAAREQLLAERLRHIRGATAGGIEELARSTERVIERLNDSDFARAAIRGQVHKAGMEAIEQIRQGRDPRGLSLESRLGFEALVRLTDRPALQLENDTVSADDPLFADGGWGGVLVGNRHISAVSKAVGRINLEGQQAGTGFAVGSDLIMTNRHVLEVIAEEVRTSQGTTWVFPFGKVEIDFSFEGSGGPACEIREVVFAGSTPTHGKVDFNVLDLVLLRVASGTGYPAQPLEVIEGSVPLEKATEVYVVGYPARPGHGAFVDPETGKFSMEIANRLSQIYDLQFGKKYVSPGMVMTPTGGFPNDTRQWVFSHDATTLNGNSGSVVVPLNGRGKVVGLHFAGSVLTGNFAHQVARTGVDFSDCSRRGGLAGMDEKEIAGGQQSVIEGSEPFEAANEARLLHWHDRHVCRIEVQTKSLDPKATGFLVADDLVLTNWHVVKEIEPANIWCRFDYTDAAKAADPIKVTDVLAYSEFNEAEHAAEYSALSTEHPEPTELDYALLKLSSAAGRGRYRNPDNTYSRRRYIKISGHVPEAELDETVYILQHPLGETLKKAEGPVIEDHGAEARIRYKTKTEKGSSGSPCFRRRRDKPRLVPVALHNYGDPNWCSGEWREPEFNQGIPLDLIAEDLEKKGYWPPEALKWRIQKKGNQAHRWMMWWAIDKYTYLHNIIFAPVVFIPILSLLLIGALTGWYFFGVSPSPVITHTKYAWFTPSDKSDAHKRARLTINLTILPPAVTFWADLSAKIFVGSQRFDLSPIFTVKEFTYECFAEGNCEKADFNHLFRLEEGVDHVREVEFAPASPKLTWHKLIGALFNNEKVSFTYTISYRSLSDVSVPRPPRSVSISCELDDEQVKELKTLRQFRWDDILPPAFSPYNLTCVTAFNQE